MEEKQEKQSRNFTLANILYWALYFSTALPVSYIHLPISGVPNEWSISFRNNGPLLFWTLPIRPWPYERLKARPKRLRRETSHGKFRVMTFGVWKSGNRRKRLRLKELMKFKMTSLHHKLMFTVWNLNGKNVRKIHLTKYVKLQRCKDDRKWTELTKMWKQKENSMKEKHSAAIFSACWCVTGNGIPWELLLIREEVEEKRHQAVKEEEGTVSVWGYTYQKNKAEKRWAQCSVTHFYFMLICSKVK